MKLKELQIRVDEVKRSINEIPAAATWDSAIEAYLIDRLFWLELKMEELQDEHI